MWFVSIQRRESVEQSVLVSCKGRRVGRTGVSDGKDKFDVLASDAVGETVGEVHEEREREGCTCVRSYQRELDKT